MAAINQVRVRAFALLVKEGKPIEEVKKEYRVPVYIELIGVHGWELDQVDTEYKKEVEEALGIIEA